MRKLALLLLPLLINLFTPPTYAHVGGIPFLKINGQYAPANAAYFFNPNLKNEIPQDLAPAKYLVDENINFEIDTTQIPLPKEKLEKATFRWDLDKGSNDYKYGLKLNHSYHRGGSHLISLEVKSPDEADYTLYDIIQIDIIPSVNYQLPSAVIAVDASQNKSSVPINFQAHINTNPGNKITDYFWFVEDEKISSQQSISHIFNDRDFFTLVFLQYTDDKGFTGYRAVWVEGIAGKINFPFPPNSHDEVQLSQNSTVQSLLSDQTTKFLLPMSIIIFLPLIVGLIFWRRKWH